MTSTSAVQKTGRWFTTAALMLLMLASSALAYHFTPRDYLADHGIKVKLSSMLPEQFGDWRIDPSIAPVVADPSQFELIDQLYSETLSRTYVNKEGRRVMLTVAYGRDQSESVQLHTPEFCYRAQGFKVEPSKFDTVNLGFKQQPVVKVLASMPGRNEPITYWVTMGEHVVNGGFRARRDLRFIYGFKGFIPDGLLFRVSSLGADVSEEYSLQRRFMTELFATMPVADRDRLAGSKAYD